MKTGEMINKLPVFEAAGKNRDGADRVPTLAFRA